MEKTEMMKKFEAETGKQSAIVKFMAGGQAMEIRSYPRLGVFDYSVDYISWLESKASAYDRLMSGGELTMKELANILKHPVAIENDEGQNTLYFFRSTPHIGQFSDGIQFWSCNGKCKLPRQLVNFNGDWEDSLTLPDGWEEA